MADQTEILFFRGYAFENSHYGFGVHEANGSGYCSQEKVVSQPDPQIFEMFWEPEKTEFTEGAPAEVRENVKYNNPEGFSGSLVWNTRLMEVEAAGRRWSPDDAVVTGLLRRWDPNTKTLLVLRIEHLRTWIEAQIGQ